MMFRNDNSSWKGNMFCADILRGEKANHKFMDSVSCIQEDDWEQFSGQNGETP